MANNTKEVIEKCFVKLINEKPLDKLSIKDITDECGITRNAFYYYYEDIYALLFEIFDRETKKITNNMTSLSSWQEAYKYATNFARENKKGIYHIYNSSHRDILDRYFDSTLLASISMYLKQEAEGLNVSNHIMENLSHFYTAALIGLINYWLKNDMMEEMDNDIEEIGFILNGNIRNVLEKSVEYSKNKHKK